LNILLVRLRLIGDVVFTTPAIRALKLEFPTARLTYLVEPEAAAVVCHHPLLDDVVVAARRSGLDRLREDWSLARRLRRERFDVAIDFHGGPRAAWLACASGAARRVGYATAGRSWLYTDVVPRPRDLRPRHSVVNQWDLLARLAPRFKEAPDPGLNPVEMYEDPAAASAVERRLRESGAGPPHRLIVVHVSAGNPFRRWPLSSFVDLLAGLAQSDPDRRIVVTSGPSDAAAARDVATRARGSGGIASRCIVQCGEFDLAELRALTARAALFIGGDSGPLHIASTTATPIVGLFGPTLPARSAPWRHPSLAFEAVDVGPLPCRPCHQRSCAPGDFRCLTGLATEQVLAAAERTMARSARATAV
jgi:ADP-heptose:LPS heptosyltransferase